MLSRERAKSYYDKFGRKQDSPAFYEDVATKQLIGHGEFDRAEAVFSNGSTVTGEESDRYDRFVSNYVLDLLAADDATNVLDEAHRILRPGGLLCLTSLTTGRSPGTRIVSSLWKTVYSISAALVGGCRPIQLVPLTSGVSGWNVEFNTTVSAFGITSEVLVARKSANSTTRKIGD